MITLVIVDCQNDFISGSLSVKGAKNALDGIKEFIRKNNKEIEKIIFTVDWHPINHCSFKKNGGQWPVHCVQFTPGACIESKLIKCVQALNIPYEVTQKGMMYDTEEYGAFSDIDLCHDSSLGDKYYFDSIATAWVDSEFIVCGIAGDFCVKSTIENMINNGITLKVLKEGVASIDKNVFENFIKENNLECV